MESVIFAVGLREIVTVGVLDGATVGDVVGVLDGATVGNVVGVLDGATVGDVVGVLVGDVVWIVIVLKKAKSSSIRY